MPETNYFILKYKSPSRNFSRYSSANIRFLWIFFPEGTRNIFLINYFLCYSNSKFKIAWQLKPMNIASTLMSDKNTEFFKEKAKFSLQLSNCFYNLYLFYGKAENIQKSLGLPTMPLGIMHMISPLFKSYAFLM